MPAGRATPAAGIRSSRAPPYDRLVTQPLSDADAELLMTAAVMYYERSASQKEIAERLGVSRPTVSRLLGRARSSGIVRIEIVPPHVDPQMSDRLRERLALESVHIAPGRANEADPGPLLAGALGTALDEARLGNSDVVLVSWGRAVYSLSGHVHRRLPGVIVAPAIGGNASDKPWFQTNEIARTWAAALGGSPRYLHAPALVSRALDESLREEAGISSVIGLWDTADVALVGVGAWPKPDPSYAAAGFPVDDPVLAEAAGDIAGWSFTIDGTILAYREQRRIFGVTPDQLRRIPHVICFAGSASKAQAAIGAARAGLIDVLVTDATTARAIEASLDSEPAGAPPEDAAAPQRLR